MIITGTPSIISVLAIEVRDPQHRSFQGLAIRSGESYRFPSSMRYEQSVIEALSSGLITITRESSDVAFYSDLSSGPTGPIGPIGPTGPAATFSNAGQIKEIINNLGACSGNQSIDLSLGNIVIATVSAPGTWTIVGATSGKASTVTFILTNAGANITWASVPKWPGGIPPSLTASGIDVLVLTTVDGGTTWYASSSLNLS